MAHLGCVHVLVFAAGDTWQYSSDRAKLVWLCRYAVPRNQQQQLIELLRVIEKGTAGDTTEAALAGIADVQLSLTSLEEVFLTIAKQVSHCRDVTRHTICQMVCR